MNNKKSPGKDGIPTEALKAVLLQCPRLMPDIYDAFLVSCVFPDD